MVAGDQKKLTNYFTKIISLILGPISGKHPLRLIIKRHIPSSFLANNFFLVLLVLGHVLQMLFIKNICYKTLSFIYETKKNTLRENKLNLLNHQST